MQTPDFPITMHEGEPRVLDVHLATKLKFRRPTEIRKLIARHRISLNKISVLATVAQTPKDAGGRPSVAFFLTKKQALFVTVKSETPRAIEVTLDLIDRFDAYERGALPTRSIATDHALAVVREARETFGVPAARRAWIALGLPAGAEMLAVAEAAQRAPQPRQASLFPATTRSTLGNPSPETLARIEARVAKGATRAAAFRAESASYGAYRVANHRRRIRACGTSLT